MTTRTTTVMAHRHNAGAEVIPISRTAARHAGARRRAYVLVPEDTRVRVVTRLLALEIEAGGLKKADYSREADACGVSASAVEKWVRQARKAAAAGQAALPQPRAPRCSKVVVDDEILLALHGKSMMAGYLDCLARGLVDVHYTTFRNAVINQVSPDILAGVQRGERALPQHWVYLERGDNPLMDMVTIDLFFPRVRCVDDATGEIVHPVWAAVRERASGILLTWHLFRGVVDGYELDSNGEPKIRAAASGILALLGEGFRGFERDGVFVGGVPTRLRCDREALFLTQDNRAALMALGIAVDPTNSYSSWENGAHERMHQVIRQEALAGLPSSTRGPVTRTGELVHAGSSIGFDELTGLLDRWAMSYNFERVNSAVGMTPFEYWTERVAAGDVVEKAAPATLAALALPGEKTYKRGKHGITQPDGAFTSHALMNHPRREFVLARWPNDIQRREAFDAATGEWVATVHRRDAAPAAEEAAILARRGKARRTVQSLQEEAKRRYAIAHGPTPARPEPPAPDDPAEVQTVAAAGEEGCAGPADPFSITASTTTSELPPTVAADTQPDKAPADQTDETAGPVARMKALRAAEATS
jgi:hypothetical protein